MSSKSTIEHKGKIISITPEITTVEIIAEEACGSCNAKSLCSLGNAKTKLIEVPTRINNLGVGDEVIVELKASMGHRAVWLAYIIPLLILIFAIMITSLCGLNELMSGLIGLGSIGVYYIIIYLFRSKLRKEYIFNIKQ